MTKPAFSSAPTLVYLMYGNNDKFQRELTYSVMSALREAKEPVRIVLVCEEANVRHDLPIEHYVMSAEEFDTWTFGRTYFHPLKVFATLKGLESTSGPMCYVDTDTAFLDAPARLFERITPDTVLMHAKERPLSDYPDWAPILRQSEAAGVSDFVNHDTIMYNAGIMGAMPSAHATVLSILDLIRPLHDMKDHPFNIEQLAVSSVLQNNYKIAVAKDVIEHYWGFRQYIYHSRLPAILSALPDELSVQTAQALPPVSAPPKPLAARLQARLAGTLFGMTDDERFACLAYHCSRSAGTAEDREIWDAIARHALKRAPDPEAFAKRHLKALTL